MNQYFEYKDLTKFEFEGARITKRGSRKGKTEIYSVPKSEDFPDNSFEKKIKKYDIQFNRGEKEHTMIRVVLKVQAHKKEGEKEIYDIETFEWEYSDAVLKCCLEDWLNFDDNKKMTNEELTKEEKPKKKTTSQKRAKFAMGSLDECQIVPMLDDYAKRSGVIRLNREYPRNIWLVCYEHCAGNKKKSDAEKNLITFCINCVNDERYIYDIYITKSYEELIDNLKKSMGNEPSGDEDFERECLLNMRRYMFCINSSKELRDKIYKEYNNPELFYDVSLVMMHLDSIISTLRTKSKYRIILERYREDLMDAYKKCGSTKCGSKEHTKAKHEFINVLLDLRRKTIPIFEDFNNKDSREVYIKLEDLWNELEKDCVMCMKYTDESLPARDRSSKWIDNCEDCIRSQMEALGYSEFLGMESYRIQYLLDVFLHNQKNITPERLRLKMLCNYDFPNKHSITVKKEYVRTIVLEPGKRLNKRDRTKEYRPLLCNVHIWAEKDKIHIVLPEQIRYVEGERNVLLKSVCRGEKVKSIQNAYMLPEMAFSTPHLYRSKVNLRPVPAPRINGPYVTLSDVCKRLEKLVYDM